MSLSTRKQQNPLGNLQLILTRLTIQLTENNLALTLKAHRGAKQQLYHNQTAHENSSQEAHDVCPKKKIQTREPKTIMAFKGISWFGPSHISCQTPCRLE